MMDVGEIDEHSLTKEEVCVRYNTEIGKDTKSIYGLNFKQIGINSSRYGKNVFSKPKKKSPIKKFAQIFIQPFNFLLLVAAILSWIVYSLNRGEKSHLYLGIAILIVSCLNTCIEFYQEYKSAMIMESFKKLVPGKAIVVREGEEREIEVEDIVVGDVLILKLGTKVGADVRLFYANDLKVDNSSITGESEPILKNTQPEIVNVIRASNLVFSGNMVVSGSGKGVVIRVGDNTILGKIAKLTVEKKKEKSQLSEEINTYIKKLGFLALITSIIFYLIAIFNGFKVKDNLGFCIGLFIAFVPQGLPTTVTILLTIAAKRMANSNVLVKDLKAVETLGSISLLATDKTGTLTKGKMTCVDIWINNRIYSLNNNKTNKFMVNFTEAGKNLDTGSFTTTSLSKNQGNNIANLNVNNFKKAVIICSTCTNAKITNNKIIGDPTESALLRLGVNQTKEHKFLDDEVRKLSELKIHEIPFNSETKKHITVFEDEEGYTIFLKGAPERIFSLCGFMAIDDESVKIDNGIEHEFNFSYKSLASSGKRVIALAEKRILKKEIANLKINEDNEYIKLPDKEIQLELMNSRFICMIGIVDPPKHGVRSAITKFRMAGIQVVMVTGDHPLTAESIARQITMISGLKKEQVAENLGIPVNDVREDQYQTCIVNGDQLPSMSTEEWDKVLSKKEIIFARTSPNQKLQIVERFQAKGHIVGVSGDGVNDSPALKKAHLGISMNETASDVSKEAASMILLDDNFSSIVNGVLEGRLIFANLKKSVRYILSHITPQVVPYLLFVSMGVPSPMSSLLLMFIDLFTEFFPAVFLAWEPP